MSWVDSFWVCTPAGSCWVLLGPAGCPPAGFSAESAALFGTQQGFSFWDMEKRCRGALCGWIHGRVRVQQGCCDGVFVWGNVGVMCGVGVCRGRVLGFLEVFSAFLSILYHYVWKGTKWSFGGLRVRFTWFAEMLE